MEDVYHEAAMFEHVAKMSRMPDSPRNKPSFPPVRFRPSIQPLSDLSHLPPTKHRPLIGRYDKHAGSSSDTETEREPIRTQVKDTSSSPTRVPQQVEDSVSEGSTESSVKQTVDKERNRNKERQREIIKEQENESLASEERPLSRRGQGHRDRKKDWVRVQSEIEAAIDQSVEPTSHQSPRRKEKLRKSDRAGSADDITPNSKKLGRNMRAIPRGGYTKPGTPRDKAKSKKKHTRSLDDGDVALYQNSARLVSYRPIEQELLQRMTKQSVERQRLTDATRARLVWAPGDRNQSYPPTTDQSSHSVSPRNQAYPSNSAFSPSASQVGESASETPSALERLLNEGTANGLPRTRGDVVQREPYSDRTDKKRGSRRKRRDRDVRQESPRSHRHSQETTSPRDHARNGRVTAWEHSDTPRYEQDHKRLLQAMSSTEKTELAKLLVSELQDSGQSHV